MVPVPVSLVLLKRPPVSGAVKASDAVSVSSASTVVSAVVATRMTCDVLLPAKNVTGTVVWVKSLADVVTSVNVTFTVVFFKERSLRIEEQSI